jgi:hypothetical protein
MDTIYSKTLDPQRVEPKALALLAEVDREQVFFCQQAFYPLPGDLAQRLREAAGRKEKRDGK